MTISSFQHKKASLLQYKILEVLAYFDIFRHPVQIKELSKLLNIDVDHLTNEMKILVDAGVCSSLNEYFSIQKDIKPLIDEREIKSQIASQYYPKIQKYAQIIQKFPYVRGIAISGSLSKGVMQKDGDIDFFIITAQNRLWICRSLLILYKKIRLLNSRKYFCLNYFVDTNHLEIIDKNIFTAMELFFLIPVYSHDKTLELFFSKNQWIKDFVNINADQNQAYLLSKTKQKNSILEKSFNGVIGNYSEHWLHRLTLTRWRKKFKHFGNEKFELTMRSTKGVSKHHPQDFQNEVLLQLKSRMDKIFLS